MRCTFLCFCIAFSQFLCSQVNDLSISEERITFSKEENQIFNWFENQQLSNGLLATVEGGDTISLYDNALAALVFILKKEYPKAEKIFDYFNARIDTELTNGVGGFSQLRNGSGEPNNKRWMGDNAWLLIALNNYKENTGSDTYAKLATKISSWLQNLQDIDGGLFAGYNSSDELMKHKVTEGNIDAFNAITGYSKFHSNLLSFLKKER